MADFKLTYATMFNPPDELHTGFDKAVEALKKNFAEADRRISTWGFICDVDLVCGVINRVYQKF